MQGAAKAAGCELRSLVAMQAGRCSATVRWIESECFGTLGSQIIAAAQERRWEDELMSVVDGAMRSF